jgi:hypothetical protein
LFDPNDRAFVGDFFGSVVVSRKGLNVLRKCRDEMILGIARETATAFALRFNSTEWLAGSRAVQAFWGMLAATLTVRHCFCLARARKTANIQASPVRV